MGIDVRNITLRDGAHTVIDDVSLSVEDGEFTVLLGGARSGKTSLLRILAGLERPARGTVMFDGKPLSAYPRRDRPVAMVYQQFINYPSFTIYDNIASPLRLKRPRLEKAEIDRRVRETAEMLGLSGVLDHLPEAVSGGQQQRTAIARALAKDAKYVFLDEPLANLDYKLREELRTELKRIFNDRGGAMVYATAEPIDAIAMGTHVAFLNAGRILQFGPAREVYDAPATAEVGAYFSHPMMNLIKAAPDESGDVSIGSDLHFALGDIADHAKGEVVIGVRADALRRPRDDDEHRFKARVELAEVVGSDTELHLDYGGLTLVALLQDFTRFDIGDEIEMACAPNDVYVFDATTRKLVGQIGA